MMIRALSQIAHNEIFHKHTMHIDIDYMRASSRASASSSKHIVDSSLSSFQLPAAVFVLLIDKMYPHLYRKLERKEFGWVSGVRDTKSQGHML